MANWKEEIEALDSEYHYPTHDKWKALALRLAEQNEQIMRDLVSSNPSLPCGHPHFCDYRDGVPTGVCRWCEQVERLEAELATEREKHSAHHEARQRNCT